MIFEQSRINNNNNILDAIDRAIENNNFENLTGSPVRNTDQSHIPHPQVVAEYQN